MMKTTAGVPQGGTLFDASPGFLIQSATVTNNSGKWLYFPALGVYCPPFQSGNLLAPGGALRLECRVQQPAALYNTGADGYVQVVMYNEVIGAPSLLSSGPVLTQGVTSIPYAVQVASGGAVGTTMTATLAVPATAGNMLVLIVGEYTGNAMSFTGANWSTQLTGNSSPQIYIFTCKASGGEKTFVSSNGGNSSYYAWACIEYSNLTQYVVANAGGALVSSSASFASVSVSPSLVPYWMVFANIVNSLGNYTVTKAPFTLSQRAFIPGTTTVPNPPMAVYDGYLTSSGTFTPAGAWSVTGPNYSGEVQLA